MKTKLFLASAIFISGALLFSCKKENNEPKPDPTPSKTEGVVEFRTFNPVSNYGMMPFPIPVKSDNPPLTGEITETIMTGLKMTIGDVWISQDEIIQGEPDTLKWVRLTSTTNTELMNFEDFNLDPKEIPAGTYKSMKLTFRNIFYRQVRLASDPSVVYSLLETMGSWDSPCDPNDKSWKPAQYFNHVGNYELNANEKFDLPKEEVTIYPFEVKAGKKAIINWRLFQGSTDVDKCRTYLIDENGNLEWDCGIDKMDFYCPEDVDGTGLWDFEITYE